MKKIVFLLIISALSGIASAQKLVLNNSLYDRWPEVHSGKISNDGNYISYKISNQYNSSGTTILQADRAKWKRKFNNVRKIDFTVDSKYAIIVNEADSLFLVNLSTNNVSFVNKSEDFDLINNYKSNLIIYKTKNSLNQLEIYNVNDRSKLNYHNVTNHSISKNGSFLLLESSESSGLSSTALLCVDLISFKSFKIWEGPNPVDISYGGVIFDSNCNQMIYTVKNKNYISYWYYNFTNQNGKMLVDGLMSNLQLGKLSGFSDDGSSFLFNSREGIVKASDYYKIPVHIWSYMDSKIKSDESITRPQQFLSIMTINNQRIVQIEDANNRVLSKNGTYALVANYKIGNASSGEKNWNTAALFDVYLVSLSDGTKNIVNYSTKDFHGLSPNSSYVYYHQAGKIFTFNIHTQKTVEITKNFPTTFNEPSENSLNITGWIKNDKAVMLSDGYDLWKVDFDGVMSTTNLTSRIGKRYKIRFSTIKENNVFDLKEKLILNAFDTRNKKNGFYSKKINSANPPKKLTMGDYIYQIEDFPGGLSEEGSYWGERPIKAKNCDAYLISRRSAKESPNYYLSSDFKTFARVTDNFPEKKYSWFTSELHDWTSLDGTKCQGILYKPENFDIKKKYPVIFYYYDGQISNGLNAYIKPHPSYGSLNIAMYVTDGYLVFVVDTYIKSGKAGFNALSAIVSAADYLSQFDYVNNNKLGLQGCSFGAYETNFVVTHSNRFAAACPTVGPTDLLQNYGSLKHVMSGESWAGINEIGQMRLGATPWSNLDVYLKNSPIINADKILTPMLMMYNKNDAVHYVQGVNLFIALRRLGKTAWMLEYDDGDHGVDGDSALDFDLRMKQFFNFYLKDMPAPKWMLESMPYNLLKDDDGLTIDSSDKYPPVSPLLHN